MDVLNCTIVCDINHLSEAEIKEEYKRLMHLYNTLKSTNEQDLQKIHELKRNLQTTTAAESYLSTELELITSAHATDIEVLNSKCHASMEEIKCQNMVLRRTNDNLENECEILRKEVNDLKIKFATIQDESQNRNIASPKLIGPSELEINLEKENKELMELNNELREKYSMETDHLHTVESQLNDLREKIICLEDNLQAKREELEEKDSCIETAHAQLIELNAELALLKNVPEDQNRKGNSLFAEVDDQRQKMKSLLSGQKKHYLQMKLAYNESEKTIRHLKSENAAFCKEIEKCTSIFLNADKLYKEKLYERISQKTKENEILQKKLIWAEDKLVNVANENGMKWVDSLFSFCKSETENCKKQLESCSVQKNLFEDSFSNSQVEMAKWRLEAIKSRWIISKLEALLEENGIQYSKTNKHDFSEKELENVKPNILVKINVEAIKNEDPKVVETMQEDKVKVSVVPKIIVDNKTDIEVNENVSKVHGDSIMDVKLIKKEEAVIDNTETSIVHDPVEKPIKSEELTADMEILNDDELAAIIDRICSPTLENHPTVKPDITIQSKTEKCTSPMTNSFIPDEVSSKDTPSINQIKGDNKENEIKTERQFEYTNDDSVQLLSKYRDISFNSHLTEKKLRSQQKIEQRITKYMNGPKLNKISPPPTSILSRTKDILPFYKEKKTVNFSDKLCDQMDSNTTDKTDEDLPSNKPTRNKKSIVVKRIVITSLKK